MDEEGSVDPEEEVSIADLETIEEDLVMFNVTSEKNEIESELYFNNFVEAMSFMNFATLKFTEVCATTIFRSKKVTTFAALSFIVPRIITIS